MFHEEQNVAEKELKDYMIYLTETIIFNGGKENVTMALIDI